MYVGILVGGRSSRMGRAKALLEVGQETLLSRTVRVVRQATLEPVLLGECADYDDHVPEVPRWPDEPAGMGPMGGLAALLRRGGTSILVGCDMPALNATDLIRLAAHPNAPLVAPHRDVSPHQGWQPLFARYDETALETVRDALAARRLSLRALFDRLPCERFEMAAAHLVDWDTPEDVPS